MVFLVPDLYNRIKEEGRREGLAMVRAEARENLIAEVKRDSFVAGFGAGFSAAIDAMREVGVDEETIRRVEDDLAQNGWRNGGSWRAG